MLNNTEIVTYALYLLGGDTGIVHTERIAIKAYEISPQSFSWELDEYSNYINLAYVYSALSDARKKTKYFKNGLLSGEIKVGFSLTLDGLELAKQTHSMFYKDEVMQKKRKPTIEEKKQTNWARSQIRRIDNDKDLSRIILKDFDTKNISKIVFNKFFQIDDYMNDKTREKIIERYKIVFIDNEDINKKILEIADLYKKFYGEITNDQ
jgi:hypothetical protein